MGGGRNALMQALRRAGTSPRRWKKLEAKLDKALGKGKWALTRDGVKVGKRIVLSPLDYLPFLAGQISVSLVEVGPAEVGDGASAGGASVAASAPEAPPKVQVKIGTTKTTVEAGPDGKLGTADDEVSVESYDYAETEDGRFECLHCGRVLKTERGMVAHIDREHSGG